MGDWVSRRLTELHCLTDQALQWQRRLRVRFFVNCSFSASIDIRTHGVQASEKISSSKREASKINPQIVVRARLLHLPAHRRLDRCPKDVPSPHPSANLPTSLSTASKYWVPEPIDCKHLHANAITVSPRPVGRRLRLLTPALERSAKMINPRPDLKERASAFAPQELHSFNLLERLSAFGHRGRGAGRQPDGGTGASGNLHG